jgi:DNA uptake protein ComE-like DNA-binding protein
MKLNNFSKNRSQASCLSFSRTQRRAILVISIIATAALLVSRSGIFENEVLASDPFVASEVSSELVARDTSNHFSPYTPYATPSNHTNYTHPSRKTAPEASFQSGTLASFDPNTVTLEQLIEMGLREKAARNLVNYRSKGGRFHTAEDLGKLYGMRPEELEVLLPLVRIDTEEKTEMVASVETFHADVEVPNPTTTKSKSFNLVVDVNLADSLTWTMLPGIGAKRASSILRFRSKLGGFASADQVGETFGLPDSVFQKIRPHLQWSAGAMEQLSLNEATEADLKSHPYINWQMAKIIVAYRNQHGPYQRVDDLLKIHIIQKDWLEKVRPYLKAEQSASASLAVK